MVIAVISTYDWIKKTINYGSILQYFALQEYLASKGHKVYWIRYNPKEIVDIPNNIPLLKYYRRKISRYIFDLYNKIFKKYKLKQILECTHEIDLFINTYLNLSEIEYFSWEEILSNPPNAEIYVTGSDQVWLGLNKANYLEFVPKGFKCVSYGASFGKSHFSTNEYKEISKMLKKFELISVRENDGLKICSNAGRPDAIQVVDPTFLLKKSFYVDFIEKYSKEKKNNAPYIFSYFLNIKKSEQVYWNSIKNYAIKKSYNTTVVPVQGAEFLFPNEKVVMPSPIDWLKYILYSECVITNSFHGTLFSIIMKKPFLVILQNGDSSAQNGRFHSFLEILDLKSRIFNKKNNLSLEDQMEKSIDWGTVQSKKEILIRKSQEFLTSCGF